SAGQRQQPALLLLLCAVVEYGQRADRAVRVPARRQRLVALAQLLHRDDVAHHPDRGAAVFLRDERSTEPQLTHLPEHVAGKAMGQVPLFSAGSDDLAGKVTTERLQLPLLVSQL